MISGFIRVMAIVALYAAPDGNEKPRLQKTIFSWLERATGRKLLYKHRKKVF